MSNNKMSWGDEMEMEEEKIVVVKPVENKWATSINLTSVLDTEDFPVLGQSTVVKKTTTTATSIIIPEIVEEKNLMEKIPDEKVVKSAMCKTIKEGKECPYGLKCKYAHYDDELFPNECNFGDRCFRIKYTTQNIVKNVDNKNVCCYIHPEETISMYIKRHGLSPEGMKRPDPEVVYKYTRMCQSILDNIPCEKGDECTYAHTFEQLRTSECMFGNECHHILKNAHGYVNNHESSKTCFYIHPDENLDNLKKRIIDIRKKRSAKENIDTTKVKKQKVETKHPAVVEVKKPAVVEVKKPAVVEVKKPVVVEVKKPVVVEVKKPVVVEVKKPVVVEVKKNEPSIIIEVDKENAADIIQKMIASGIQNFQIKIRA